MSETKSAAEIKSSVQDSLDDHPILNSNEKSRSEAAKRAVETMRRRGKPPKFEASMPDQALILKQAYRAASAAVGRAIEVGLPYEEEWMLKSLNLIIEQNFCCAATGLGFDLKVHKTKGAGGTHFAPSPDRIVAEKGYVSGNVRWVLWAVNRAKGEMPEDLFIKICREVVKRHDAADRPA